MVEWLGLGFVSRSPWFNASAALVRSQLVCLLPVGILNPLSLFLRFVSLALKSPSVQGLGSTKHQMEPPSPTQALFPEEVSRANRGKSQ